MTCALCGDDLRLVLDLGKVPPANRYRRPGELLLPEPTFPLRLGVCPTCTHLQLMDTVEPETLFTDREYLYRSGVSSGWLEHCADLCRKMPVGKGALAVDLGSNDGTLLGQLAARGYLVHGIEPSAAQNALHGYPAFTTFWGEEPAKWLKRRYKQEARIVTATNVLAHVPDPVAFLAACAEVLHRDGTLVVEVPYALPMLQTGAFDPIYHEHVHYWTLGALQRAMERVGLLVVGCEEIDVHGGSLRVWAGFPGRGIDSSVDRVMIREAGSLSPAALHEFASKVDDFRSQWTLLLEHYRDQGLTVWGYGASAKGMTLLTTTPVWDVVGRIMDDNPSKQGCYTPGEAIPIGPVDQLDVPDVILLLAWNWGRPMMDRLRSLGYRGEIVVPFPELEVVQ